MKQILFTVVQMIAIVFSAGLVVRSQDDFGGSGTYIDPYFERTHPVGADDGSYSYIGQDLRDVYGSFEIRQKDYRSITFLNAAGFVTPRKVRGGAMNFTYEWDWDTNQPFPASRSFLGLLT